MTTVSEKVFAGQSWNIKGNDAEQFRRNWLWNPILWAEVLLCRASNPVTADDLDCYWHDAFQGVALEFINDRLPEGFEILADGTMNFSHYTLDEISQARAEAIAENAQWEAEYLDELFDTLADLVRSLKKAQ
jgi:hypothetical protein